MRYDSNSHNKTSVSDSQSQDSTNLTIEELQQKLQDQAAKIESLENTRKGLLSDLKKKKNIDLLVKAAGLDLSQADSEEKIADLLSARSSSSADPGSGSATQEPAGEAKGQGVGQTPSDAVDSALKAQLASLQTKITRLEEEKERERTEKLAEKELRRNDILRSKVVQEMEKADCERPSHLYLLLHSQGKFKLLEDNETVIFGSEDDPVAVRDAVTKLREDPEYSIYFRGSGATGSGLPPARTTVPIGNNPFAVGSANATEAARIMQDDPARARRLMQDARLAGKLDPIIGRALSGS